MLVNVPANKTLPCSDVLLHIYRIGSTHLRSFPEIPGVIATLFKHVYRKSCALHSCMMEIFNGLIEMFLIKLPMLEPVVDPGFPRRAGVGRQQIIFPIFFENQGEGQPTY